MSGIDVDRVKSAVYALSGLLACLAGGVMIALQTGRPRGLVAGLVAGTMHMAWSAGFWREWLARRPAAERTPA